MGSRAHRGGLVPVLTACLRGAKARRLRQELQDAVELVLLPGLAAVLPWRIAFGVFKRLARLPFLYAAPSNNALAHAKNRIAIADEKAWLYHRRLVTLVDHSDHYLVRTRSNRWLKRHVDVEGAWSGVGQAGLKITFHWGAGMWALRHAQAAGLKLHPLVAGVEGAHFAGRTVLHRYINARNRSVVMALGVNTINVLGSLRPVFRAFQAHEQVLAVIDVPADQAVASQTVDLAGLRARVPVALLKMAVEKQLPVEFFITGINMQTGQRFITIENLGVHTDLTALLTQAYGHLNQAIASNSAAWHFWGESERFFVNA